MSTEVISNGFMVILMQHLAGRGQYKIDQNKLQEYSQPSEMRPKAAAAIVKYALSRAFLLNPLSRPADLSAILFSASDVGTSLTAWLMSCLSEDSLDIVDPVLIVQRVCRTISDSRGKHKIGIRTDY